MACPVCFGGEDTAMRESLNAGIGVLMGVTMIVLAAFARFIVVLARRSHEAAHLVDVEAGHLVGVEAGHLVGVEAGHLVGVEAGLQTRLLEKA